MNFLKPQLFIVLWCVPLFGLLFFLAEKKRARRLRHYSKLRLQDLMTHTRSKRRSFVKGFLICLATVLIIFSLSRPRFGFQWQEKPTGGIDIGITIP